MRKSMSKSITALFLLWVLTSCGYESSTTLPSTSTRPSATLIGTLTPTVIPIQTITPIVTLSPQPTLTKERAQEVIGKLLAKNGDCIKPCFWGFSPAFDVQQEQILNYFTFLHEKPGIIRENGKVQYIATIGYKERINVSSTFNFDENQQNLLNLSAQIHGLYYPEITYADWEAFRPENVLKAYGTPTNVEFFLNYPTEPTTDQTIGYDFRFRYDSEKFVIDYTGQRSLNQPQLYICPLEDLSISSIYLYLGDYLKIKPTNGKSLQDVSSVSIDDFYNAMTGSINDACFYLDNSSFRN